MITAFPEIKTKIVLFFAIKMLKKFVVRMYTENMEKYFQFYILIRLRRFDK